GVQTCALPILGEDPCTPRPKDHGWPGRIRSRNKETVMRKKLLMTLWLLVPIFVLAFHYGPGQKGLIRDRAAEKIKAAMKAEKEEDWSGAVAAYDEALSILPGDQKELRFKLQCAHANARMFSGQLPEAINELE